MKVIKGFGWERQRQRLRFVGMETMNLQGFRKARDLFVFWYLYYLHTGTKVHEQIKFFKHKHIWHSESFIDVNTILYYIGSSVVFVSHVL